MRRVLCLPESELVEESIVGEVVILQNVRGPTSGAEKRKRGGKERREVHCLYSNECKRAINALETAKIAINGRGGRHKREKPCRMEREGEEKRYIER